MASTGGEFFKSLLFLSSGDGGGVSGSGARGQGLQGHMAFYLECPPREGKQGRGTGKEKWGL